MVKHKSKYSCEGSIYIKLDTEIIKESCKFLFYYNKTGITPKVFNGGNEIILANWPNNKHIFCSINNDTPVRIPSHPYVLVNRSILCNCGIEVENNFFRIFGSMSRYKFKIGYVFHGEYSFCQLPGPDRQSD